MPYEHAERRLSFLEFKQEVALALIEMTDEDVPFPSTELMRSYWYQSFRPDRINMHSQCAKDWIDWSMAH